MPIAAVALEFDPFLRLGGAAVRLETLGVAAAIVVALLAAGRLAGQRIAQPEPTGSSVRPDDVAFLALAIVPGAVLGGRIGYVLLHLDYYAAHPGAVLDPGQGSLELGLAVAGGTLTGVLAAELLGLPVGRWLHVAAVPTLVGIGLGKVAMALGGSGQGTASDLPWATSYLGPGPWGSLAAGLPSHPSQLYEAIGTAVVLAVLAALSSQPLFRRADGLAFAAAIGGWAAVRFIVAATWREAPVLGPVGADQLISLALLAATTQAAIVLVRRRVLDGEGVSWGSPPSANGVQRL